MHKLQFLCDIFGVFDVLVVIATSIDVYVLHLWIAHYVFLGHKSRALKLKYIESIGRALYVLVFVEYLCSSEDKLPSIRICYTNGAKYF